MLLIGPLEKNFSAILIKIYIQGNAFENVVCKLAAISWRPQCVTQLMFSFSIADDTILQLVFDTRVAVGTLLMGMNNLNAASTYIAESGWMIF